MAKAKKRTKVPTTAAAQPRRRAAAVTAPPVDPVASLSPPAIGSLAEEEYREALGRLLERAQASGGQLVLDEDETLDLRHVLVGVYTLLADRWELGETRDLLKSAAEARAQTPGSGSTKNAAACAVLGLGGPPRGEAARALRARFYVLSERPLLNRWLQLTREDCGARAGAPMQQRLRTARRVALNTLSEQLGEDSETTGRRLRKLRAKLREALEGERAPSPWRTYVETLSDPTNPAYVPDGRDDLAT